jgi:hypothetical protein
MSIYDKASLVQIPSGYKGGSSNGTLYNVVPNTADGDFRHTRATTATRVNKDGLIETVAANTPRLDYPLIDGVVQDCPALLLEPQRTNNMTHSEDFSVYTLASGTSSTANAGTSPTGENNATLIYPSSSGSNKGLYKNTSSSTTGTVSCFVKRSGKNFAIIGTDNGATRYCIFDLVNETVVYEATNYTGKIEKHSNDWYRISSTYTSSAAANYPFVGVADNSSGDVTVDGTNGILIFGMQYEYNSYATSYIPTSGSAVTRSADVCNRAEADFNDSEGVLFAEINTLADDGTNRYISLSDSSISNAIVIRIGGANTILSRLFRGGSPVGSAIIDDNTDTKTNMKVAIVYNNTSHSLYVNGFNIGTEIVNSSYTSGTLIEVNFDGGGGGSDFYGKSKQLMTFNEALSDTELENLTSWDSFREMATEQLYSIE